jgi:hypothetical protein
MPASTSSTGFTYRRVLGEAYSLKKIALSSPIGIAKTSAHKVVLRVPTTMFKTPKLAGCRVGAQVSVEKNSPNDTSPKNPMLGTRREITIAAVVTTDSSAHRAKTALTAFSPYRGLEAERDRGGISAPVPLANSIASRASTLIASEFRFAFDHLFQLAFEPS